ncbi:MAG: hypothetical protein M2R46_02582 [Verrucomicrobia subdivision 3 bacterium]|nr:hypothetical protein [Limisphaerales bacterium]
MRPLYGYLQSMRERNMKTKTMFILAIVGLLIAVLWSIG